MERFLRVFKNQAGGSELMAVVLAMGLGSILFLTNAEMFSQIFKGQQQTEQTMAALDIRRELEVLLSDPIACQNNFQGLTGNGSNLANNFVDKLNTAKFIIGQSYSNNSVRLIDWNLTDTDTIIANTTPIRRIVDLNIRLQKTGDNVSSQNRFYRTIKIHTERVGNATSAIARCYSLHGYGSDIWIRDITGVHIHNTNSNNVAIGQGFTPLARLHVGGDMRVAGTLTSTELNSVGGGNLTATNTVYVGGTVGIGGVADPAYRLRVYGNTAATGSLTAADITNPLMTATGNATLGSLTVDGLTSLAGTLTTSGNTDFTGPTSVQGNAILTGQSQMNTTLAVNGPLVAGTVLSVTGTWESSGGTGNITAQRTISSAYCIDGNCKTTFAQQNCPFPGQVVRQLNTDGTVVCSDPRCPANTFYQGLNADGTPRCITLPTPSCAANTYITNYDAVSGTYTCAPLPPGVAVGSCPAGQYLYGVVGLVPDCRPIVLSGAGTCPAGQSIGTLNADGTAVCKPSFQNTDDTDNCVVGQVVTGINADGTPRCANLNAAAATCSGAGQVLVGINTNGSPQCGSSLSGGSCAAGQIATGFNSNGTPQCGAASAPPATDGVCGPAHTNNYAAASGANSAGLCSAGIASPTSVSGAGPWTWRCAGVGGGQDVNCYANQTTATYGVTELENCSAPVGAACSPAGWQPIYGGWYIVDTCGCPGGNSTSMECSPSGTVVLNVQGYCM